MNPANDTPEELAASETDEVSEQIQRPFSELRDSGLLWLINTSLLHPRGYALALHFDGDGDNLGACTGWSILGDGLERWNFTETPEMETALDDIFLKIRELLP